MKQRHNYKKAFSLIEAAIVLGVVGLVIGGIWIGAATLKQRWFEQKFMEGLVVLTENAQKYLSQQDSCSMGSFVWSNPEFYSLIYPKQWIEIGGEERLTGPSIWVGCEGQSLAFPDEKYLNLTFWGPLQNYKYFCKNIFSKVQALCLRSGNCDIPMLDYNCQNTSGGMVIDVRIGRRT